MANRIGQLKDYIAKAPFPSSASLSHDKANAEYLMGALLLFRPKDGRSLPLKFGPFINNKHFLRDRTPDIQWQVYLSYLQAELAEWRDVAYKTEEAHMDSERDQNELRQYLLDEAHMNRDG